MTRIPFERPPGDVDPRREPPRFYYPLATIKCVGTPVFRSQAARDFACLLDVNPDVASWTCEGADLFFEDDAYTVDFVATKTDGTTYLYDVADTRPEPPEWVELAAYQKGRIYGSMSMEDFTDSIRLLNSKDLLRYGFHRCPLGDRVHILAALDEMGSLTVAEALSAFREGRPMACLAALILQGFLEIEMDEALIGPETVVRRIRD
ncbi:hypothetical protein [Rhizobium leguminosarum]|uniref:hypothetical protein n=1 Tax=Rhizobium leguminosarum TaxID=384 RepID=UPI001FEF8193|nr:hypothetical protein [Rhizobium leguminosarum]